jgi:methylthioribulose-1-phosphate dehydratase
LVTGIRRLRFPLQRSCFFAATVNMIASAGGAERRPMASYEQVTSGAPREVTRQIIDAGRWLDRRGWAPATSGNYSMRLDAERIAITSSGRHKGRLTEDDVIVVDYDGKPVHAGRPSAETPLHTVMYRLDPSLGAVLHIHSVHSTVLGLALERRTEIDLVGYELLKAFPGVATHEEHVLVPIFDNTQDVSSLAQRVSARWRNRTFFGYLIRGHGLYTWGRTMDDALQLVEALEFLFACELERMKVSP